MIHSMLWMAGKKIYSQVAINMSLATLFFTFSVSMLVFFHQREESQHQSQQKIDDLFLLIEPSLSHAILSKDHAMLSSLFDGLKRSELIQNAYLLSKQQAFKPQNQHKHFALFSPRDKNTILDRLVIVPNQRFITKLVSQKITILLVLISLASLFILLVHLSLINSIILKPIRKICARFCDIAEGDFSALPSTKQKNELGYLTNNINSLLDSANTRVKRERALRLETEQLSKKFQLLFDKANVGIGLIDKKNQLVIANPTLLGLITQSYIVINDNFQPKAFAQYFQHPEEVIYFIENFRVKQADQFCATDTKLRHKANSSDKWVHCLLSKVGDRQEQQEDLIEVVLYDITARSERESSIIFAAEHDQLTGLYNRRATIPKLEASLEQAKNKAYTFALLMIDLDGFKKVNDTYGHDCGDKVISEISRRIKLYFRGTDVVSRWGGDEFLIGFSYDPAYKSALDDIVSALQQQIALPIAIGREQTAAVGSSIGISLYPKHGNDIKALIEKADISMYQVKQGGKNSYALYQSEKTASELSDYYIKEYKP